MSQTPISIRPTFAASSVTPFTGPSSSPSQNGLAALLPTLHGSGLIFVKTADGPKPGSVSFLSSGDSQIGFWYQSTVSCQPQIYVLLLPHQVNTKTETNIQPVLLSKLYQDPNVASLRLLKLKNSNGQSAETLFRAIIFSTLAAYQTQPHTTPTHLHQMLEKLVVSSEVPFLDYLKMITLVSSTSPCTEVKSNNPYLNSLPETSGVIDHKISNAIHAIRPFLKEHGISANTINANTKNIKDLESQLFDVVAIVNK